MAGPGIHAASRAVGRTQVVRPFRRRAPVQRPWHELDAPIWNDSTCGSKATVGDTGFKHRILKWAERPSRETAGRLGRKPVFRLQDYISIGS